MEYTGAVLAVTALVTMSFLNRPVRFALGVAVVMFVGYRLCPEADLLHAERTFYGVLRVTYSKDGDEPERHSLIHGTILHGTQNFDPDAAKRDRPLTYYHPTGRWAR